ncbi:hypothetical protein N7456_011700 [Penicillium angulare]|uniref:Uncharacterized protein n=1 Tax=Penicillium angulare TaxID=116970 RepID=A0A9W9EUC1_9EURO|nr:hypothetical protein N7456_011700 [Penicillium angulare]
MFLENHESGDKGGAISVETALPRATVSVLTLCEGSRNTEKTEKAESKSEMNRMRREDKK